MKRFILSLSALFALASLVGAGEPPAKLSPEQADKLKSLLKDLGSKDPAVQLAAMLDLEEFGPHAAPAVPALVKALQHVNNDLRLQAAITLGKIGKEAVTPVAKLLDSDDADTRYYALAALGWIGPSAKATAPQVLKLLADKTDSVRA